MSVSSPKRKVALQNIRIRPDFPGKAKRKAAIQLFEQGHGYKFVARVLRLSVNTVHDWQRAYKEGRFSPEISPRLYRYPDEVRQSVIDMRRRGLSWDQISKKTGINASSCRKWVAQATLAAASQEVEDPLMTDS